MGGWEKELLLFAGLWGVDVTVANSRCYGEASCLWRSAAPEGFAQWRKGCLFQNDRSCCKARLGVGSGISRERPGGPLGSGFEARESFGKHPGIRHLEVVLGGGAVVGIGSRN